MTTAPPEDQRRLLDVQELDTKLDQLAHRRRTLPVLSTLGELDGRAADVHAALVASRTAASDLRRALTKAEGDVEQVRNRVARDQRMLDSGTGTSKELLAIQDELASLARRQGDLEDVELEVMERLEAHQGALDELEKAAAELDAQRAAAEGERDAQWAEIDAEAATIAAERAAAVAGLEPGLVSLYERLRGQLGGSGAALLRGRRCEGCRLELNPMDVEALRKAAPETVTRCEECGRILVRLPAGGGEG